MSAAPNPIVPGGPLARLALVTGAQPAPGHRERLVLGMVAAVSERGYAATTITDVVRYARVSRRTFYEHFADKEACFLAAYDAVSDAVLAGIGEAASHGATFEAQVLASVRAYLEALAAEPRIARVFTVDILGAGPAALARRREVLRRFAAHIQALVDAAIADGAPARRLDDRTALALVGAIHELVLATLEEDHGSALPELDQDMASLVSAVLLRP
jgi:AcrR family transcriptional regulator